MNYLTLLFSVFTFVASAQLKQSEFEATMGLIGSEDQQKAQSTIEAFEKKFPKDEKVLLLRGYYQFREGDQNGALMSFSNAIKLNPKYAFAYGARSQLFSTKGMPEKAISDISEALKIEPQNTDYLKTRIGFYYQNRQFAEALADAKSKIILEPNNIFNYFDAADFTKEINANTDADVFFNQAYANKGIPKFVTDAVFGKFLLKYGRFEEAKTKYELALATNEKDFDDEDFHNVALVYYKVKNYDKSIVYFNKAIALNAYNVNYITNFASLYMDLKNWQKVKEIAEKALTVDPNDPTANYCMAIGLKFTGNETLSLEYEKKAKQLATERN